MNAKQNNIYWVDIYSLPTEEDLLETINHIPHTSIKSENAVKIHKDIKTTRHVLEAWIKSFEERNSRLQYAFAQLLHYQRKGNIRKNLKQPPNIGEYHPELTELESVIKMKPFHFYFSSCVGHYYALTETSLAIISMLRGYNDAFKNSGYFDSKKATQQLSQDEHQCAIDFKKWLESKDNKDIINLRHETTHRIDPLTIPTRNMISKEVSHKYKTGLDCSNDMETISRSVNKLHNIIEKLWNDPSLQEEKWEIQQDINFPVILN